jgi:hypothetical protein
MRTNYHKIKYVIFGILLSVEWQFHTDVSRQPVGTIFNRQPVLDSRRWDHISTMQCRTDRRITVTPCTVYSRIRN